MLSIVSSQLHILTKSLTFILKFGGDLNGKFRRRLGIETTRLDLEWPSRLFDLTAATLVSIGARSFNAAMRSGGAL